MKSIVDRIVSEMQFRAIRNQANISRQINGFHVTAVLNKGMTSVHWLIDGEKIQKSKIWNSVRS